MKTLVFEGIATSGKSKIIQLLKLSLSDHLHVRVADEEETHIPIMKATNKLHLDFYIELLDKFVLDHPDLLIIDRFYLTQAFRAKADLADYKEVENKLRAYNASTIFLKVKPTAILERIQDAAKHREPKWGEYIASKGDTPKKQAAYYISQQKSLLALLEESSLPYRVLDTTSHNYESISDDIIRTVKLSH